MPSSFFLSFIEVMEVKRFPRLHDKIVEVVTHLLQRRLPSTNEMVCSICPHSMNTITLRSFASSFAFIFPFCSSFVSLFHSFSHFQSFNSFISFIQNFHFHSFILFNSFHSGINCRFAWWRHVTTKTRMLFQNASSFRFFFSPRNKETVA